MKAHTPKKLLTGILICVGCIIVLYAVAYMLFGWGRAGGELGFYAIVTSVDGDTVTADVVEDDTPFLSRKLPDEIIFDASYSGISDLRAGDYISATYLSGTIDGNAVKVVSIVVLGTS